MKKSSIFVLCLLLICCMLVMASCSGKDVNPTSITISSQDNATEINMGETLQLTAKVNPDGASQEVVWSSSNESVATVSNSGLVTGVAEGNAFIKATSAVDSSVSKTFALVVNYHYVAPPVGDPTSIRLSTPGNTTDILVGSVMQLTATVFPSNASQDVVYSSSNEDVATISDAGVITGVAEGSAVITVTCAEASDVSSTITINVITAQGSYETMSFSTHAEYMDAKKGDEIKVKGVVTYILPENDGKVSYYLQDGVDAFYIYNQDAVNYPVELGVAYAVGGVKTYYNGAEEIKDVAYCVRLDESFTVTTVELEGKNASSKDEMAAYHGARVHAIATLKTVPASKPTSAFGVTITIGDNDTTLYIQPSNMTAENFSAIAEQLTNAAVGSEIEIYGIMTAYGYSTKSVKTEIFLMLPDELILPDASAADTVKLASENIKISTYVLVSTAYIDLPTTSPAFEDVSISWASENESIISADGTVNHPATDTIVTLTATVRHNQTSDTATATLKVYVQGTSFNGTPTVSLTFDEEEIVSAGAGQYGTSNFKGSYSFINEDKVATYEVNTFEIGGHNWLLWNTLLGHDGNDHVDGAFGARTQANKKDSDTGRIQLMDAGNYDYIQFDAAVYDSNPLGILLSVEYQLEGSDEWVVAFVVSVDSYSLSTYRIVLPEGSKKVAIVVVPESGQRANVDSISLGTIGE